VTYNFGTKYALYDAAMAAALAPSRDRLAAAARTPGAPLERIAAFVRAAFDFLREQPDVPRLMMHQLVSARPIPEAALQTLRGNLEILTSLIREGQADGSIRRGDPFLMALSIWAQPVWLTVARPALREAAGLVVDAPETRERIVESVLAFVRAGLTARPEERR
jgi:AcrR family transcriptional regulator